MPIDSATRLLDFGMYLELQINFTLLGRSLLVVDLNNHYSTNIMLYVYGPLVAISPTITIPLTTYPRVWLDRYSRTQSLELRV